MSPLYDATATQEEITLLINSDLLKKAEECHIDLNEAFHTYCTDLIRNRPKIKFPENNEEI